MGNLHGATDEEILDEYHRLTPFPRNWWTAWNDFRASALELDEAGGSSS